MSLKFRTHEESNDVLGKQYSCTNQHHTCNEILRMVYFKGITGWLTGCLVGRLIVDDWLVCPSLWSELLPHFLMNCNETYRNSQLKVKNVYSKFFVCLALQTLCLTGITKIFCSCFWNIRRRKCIRYCLWG